MCIKIPAFLTVVLHVSVSALRVQNQCLTEKHMMQVSAAVYTDKGVDKNALIEEYFWGAIIC